RSDRSDRAPRTSHNDRTDRAPRRDFADRTDRAPRRDYSDRAPASDRAPRRDYTDRAPRTYGDRNDRNDRAPRSDSKFYPSKEERTFTPHDDVVLERLEAQAIEATDVDGVTFADLGLGDNISRA